MSDSLAQQMSEKLFAPYSPLTKDYLICTRSGLESTVSMCMNEEVDFDTSNVNTRRTGRCSFSGPASLLPPNSAINGAIITPLINGVVDDEANKYKVIDNSYEMDDNTGCFNFLVMKIVNKNAGQTKDSGKPEARSLFTDSPGRRTERKPDGSKHKRHER